MKLYVDELPKSCDECPCFNEEYNCCNIDGGDCLLKNDDCFLCSLADYTKQVRKEIIEQVKDYMENHSHTISVNTKNRKVVYKIGLTRFLDELQSNDS